MNPVFADYMLDYWRGGGKGARHRPRRWRNDPACTGTRWSRIDRHAEGPAHLRARASSAPAARACTALESPAPNRLGFDLLRVMRTRTDRHLPETYFVISSFDELFEATRPDFRPYYYRLASSQASRRRRAGQRPRVPAGQRRRAGPATPTSRVRRRAPAGNRRARGELVDVDAVRPGVGGQHTVLRSPGTARGCTAPAPRSHPRASRPPTRQPPTRYSPPPGRNAVIVLSVAGGHAGGRALRRQRAQMRIAAALPRDNGSFRRARRRRDPGVATASRATGEGDQRDKRGRATDGAWRAPGTIWTAPCAAQ